MRRNRRVAAEVVLKEGFRFVEFRISHDFPDQIGQCERPEPNECQHDAGDFQGTPGRFPAAASERLYSRP